MSRRAVPTATRLGAAGLCLLLRPGHRPAGSPAAAHRDRAHRLEADVAVVLAARYAVQAGAIALGHGADLRWRAAIETLHALSMGAAAKAAPDHRRAALTALGLAAGVLSVDLGQRLIRGAARPGHGS